MGSSTDWMSLGEWVVALRALHEQARLGKLPPEELKRYLDERETLARAILAAQRLRASPSARGRNALRVARELRVDLTIDRVVTQQKTLDLGEGGFALSMPASVRVGTQATISLELEPGQTVAGRARVVSLQRQRKGYRVAFKFEGLPVEEVERIALSVFEAALEGIDPGKR